MNITTSRISRIFGLLTLTLALLVQGTAADKQSKPKSDARSHELPDLNNASWIWATRNAVSNGVAGCFFRKTFDLLVKPAVATVLITADNGYDLFINGSLAGGDTGFSGAFWSSVEKYEIEHLLVPGKNVIAVRGENLGGPAGLLAAVRVELNDNKSLEINTDKTWRLSIDPETEWTMPEHDDSKWRNVAVLGPLGMAPWGKLKYPGPVSPAHAGGGTGTFTEPSDDFQWPAAAIFLRGRVPPSSTPGAPQDVWRIGGSRAYLEFDTPGPAMLGNKLLSLKPVRPDGKITLILDAGKGLIGSPSVSYDGKEIYFSMAPEGEKFFHIYCTSDDGANLRKLTGGAFHDFDPAPLPDGRIVFSSTRIGSREEYHGNVGRSLFTMNPDGANIRPLTYHIVGDNEPKVTADGRIVFIRCDNFMERAKVETKMQIIHPDGTQGRVLLWANRGRIDYDRVYGAEASSRWLRSFGFGSPAPLPDGRVASISSLGVIASSPGSLAPDNLRPAVNLKDISPLPDGRLLCTTAGGGSIGVLDPSTGEVVRAYRMDTYDVHSVVCLGPRPRPPILRSTVEPADEDRPDETGYLLCQDVFYTKQTAADLSRIKAIRVLQGVPFTIRSARHPYDHIGVEAVELGTVPLAPDGSFFVRVPADSALALQAIDAEGRSVINEMSWIYVRPGERRTCTGCHTRQDTAAKNHRILAAEADPVNLLGQGEPHRFRGNNAANGGVLNLQFDRFREAATINLYRQGVLRRGEELPPGRPAEVKRLCDLLLGKNVALKISAARRLAIFRDRGAVSALVKALYDRNKEVRMNAAIALSSCGNREAVGDLLNALDDRAAVVAQAANMAIENLTGHSEDFNAYSRKEERKAGARRWRAWLESNDWAAIENDLIARLEADDPIVVHKAIEALGHIGGAAAKEAIRAYLAEKHEGSILAGLAAMRALGHLHDEAAVPLLKAILERNIPEMPANAKGSHELGWLQKPVHYAGAAAEALGWIATPDAEKVLLDAYPKLRHFWYYTSRTGDHSWLMGCHTSVPHYRIAEALDAMGPRGAGNIVPAMLRSVPIDTDRALLCENDGYETLVARVGHRAGVSAEVIETALAILGDAAARPSKRFTDAVTASPPAVSVGPLDRESRAAQILSVVCLDPAYALRIRAAFERYRAQPPSRKRSWTCFYLARALGKLRDPASVENLIAALDRDPAEASFGWEDPPNVFLHKAMTPLYRAAAAYSLGLIGERRAVPSLLKAVANFDNAMDVRNAAAKALYTIRDPASLEAIEKLAADYPEVATRRVLQRACAALKAR